LRAHLCQEDVHAASIFWTSVTSYEVLAHQFVNETRGVTGAVDHAATDGSKGDGIGFLAAQDASDVELLGGDAERSYHGRGRLSI
jgi:hypothetical protein